MRASCLVEFVGIKMSEHENFKEQASKRHLFIALTAMIAMPLLPMVMGWYTFLS